MSTTELIRNTSVRPIKVFTAALMITIGVSILAYAMSGDEAAQRDFISYWAAGRQLTHHQNPYDVDAVLRLEKSAGYKPDRPLVMRNPPIALAMAYPLGFLKPKTGAVLWSISAIGCLMGSIRMLWILNGRPLDRLHLIGYLFPPALACLLAGQTGIFILFGVAVFLYFSDSRPYLAGVGLFALALKPHLFLPLAVALIIWIRLNGLYRILAGACITFGVSLLIALFLDPLCWGHYLTMLKAQQITQDLIPTFSFLFRIIISKSHPWVQYMPAMTACIWTILRYRRDRALEPEFLLLLSVMVAPYAWFTDEAVVLPAILAGLYLSSKASLIGYCCIAGVALIEVFAGAPMASGAYIWTSTGMVAMVSLFDFRTSTEIVRYVSLPALYFLATWIIFASFLNPLETRRTSIYFVTGEGSPRSSR